MSKSRLDRIRKEICLVTKYLERSDLAYKFKNDNIDDVYIRRFITLCSCLAFYRRLEEDETLFNEGDIGDRFYIILEGSVKVLKALEKEVLMNAEDYLKHLLALKKRNDPYLIRKTIKANIIQFPIEYRNLEELQELLLSLRINNAVNRNSAILDIQELAEGLEEFKIDIESEKNPHKIKSKLQRMSTKHLKGKFSEVDLNKFSNTTNKENAKVKLYDYVEIVQLHKGKYFGDVALEKKNNLRYLVS